MWDDLKSRRLIRIYFLKYKKIDISKDVTFDEDTTYNKSRKRPAEVPEEAEAPEFMIQPRMKKLKKKIKNLKNLKNL